MIILQIIPKIDPLYLNINGTNHKDTIINSGNDGKVGIGTESPTNTKVHIVGDGSYVGNYGYNTLTLEDTSGYPGLNLRTGNYNWLIRKSGGDNSLQIVNSSNASGPGTGTYTNRFTILDGGAVGIGDSNPSYKLDVAGDIRASGDVITDSDIRFKTNVRPINKALSTVCALSGKIYSKDDKDNQIGLIAQDVEKILPQMVHTASDEIGTKSVNYQNMVAILIEAIKEQNERINKLTEMLESK